MKREYSAFGTPLSPSLSHSLSHHSITFISYYYYKTTIMDGSSILFIMHLIWPNARSVDHWFIHSRITTTTTTTTAALRKNKIGPTKTPPPAPKTNAWLSWSVIYYLLAISGHISLGLSHTYTSTYTHTHTSTIPGEYLFEL